MGEKVKSSSRNPTKLEALSQKQARYAKIVYPLTLAQYILLGAVVSVVTYLYRSTGVYPFTSLFITRGSYIVVTQAFALFILALACLGSRVETRFFHASLCMSFLCLFNLLLELILIGTTVWEWWEWDHRTSGLTSDRPQLLPFSSIFYDFDNSENSSNFDAEIDERRSMRQHSVTVDTLVESTVEPPFGTQLFIVLAHSSITVITLVLVLLNLCAEQSKETLLENGTPSDVSVIQIAPMGNGVQIVKKETSFQEHGTITCAIDLV